MTSARTYPRMPSLTIEQASNYPTGGRRHVGKKRGVSLEAPDGPPDRPRPPQSARSPNFDGSADLISGKAVSETAVPAFEIEIELPTSRRGLRRFINSPEAFVASQLRKQTVEVRERNLNDDELLQFKGAKGKEVKNYIQSHCFKLLPPEKQNVDAVGMRWVLTWKCTPEENTKKAKARCVILGYQDKSYEYKPTSSPTLSRVGRQVFLLLCAQMKFRVKKGDVSSAFLQGDLLEDGLHVVPTPEICEALGIPAGSVTQLQRAAYGLVEAPLWWYKSVSGFLTSIGYTRLKSEPCIWVYFDSMGTPRSVISGHVDDFLFGGDPQDDLHNSLMGKIQQKFSWGTWENPPFIQCGVRIKQLEDCSFELDQDDFIDELHPIQLSHDRVRKHDDPTNDREKTQLRAVLGSLSWLCGQTDFQHSSDVGFLISQIPQSKVSDIIKVNHLVDDVKRNKCPLKIHGIPQGAPIDLVSWADAAWANRPDHTNSTGGIIIGAATRDLREGKLTAVTLLSWRSYKIDRVSRSPACAETHAVVDGEDELFHVRYLWSELHHPPLQLREMNSDDIVRLSPGIHLTDSKNFYDKLNKDTPVIKGAERRADIEALTVKDSMQDTGLMLRWVHSDAQLANSMTKPSEKQQIQMFKQMGQKWRIIYDPNMVSARRRRDLGLKPMAQTDSR